MKRYYLDGEACTSKAAAYSAMKAAFGWPDYVGENLDAIWDALKDMSVERITILHARAIPEQLGEYGLRLLDVFGDYADEYETELRIRW